VGFVVRQDDVQTVYGDFDLSEEEIQRIGAL